MLKIDTSNVKRVVLSVVPTSSQLRQVASQLATAARAEWIRLAGDELRSSKNDYVRAISEPVFSKKGMAFSISLEGALPNMLEKGWAGGDLRAFLDGAPRARRSKAGHLYNIIPFRHGSPGSGGRNVGKPMNSKVYDLAKRLGPGERLDSRKIMDPAIAAIVRRKMAKHHTVGRYEGMIKSGGYMTFRVISEANPKGWIHPGIRARRLGGKVQRFVGELMPHVFDDLTGNK